MLSESLTTVSLQDIPIAGDILVHMDLPLRVVIQGEVVLGDDGLGERQDK